MSMGMDATIRVTLLEKDKAVRVGHYLRDHVFGFVDGALTPIGHRVVIDSLTNLPKCGAWPHGAKFWETSVIGAWDGQRFVSLVPWPGDDVAVHPLALAALEAASVEALAAESTARHDGAAGDLFGRLGVGLPEHLKPRDGVAEGGHGRGALPRDVPSRANGVGERQKGDRGRENARGGDDGVGVHGHGSSSSAANPTPTASGEQR